MDHRRLKHLKITNIFTQEGLPYCKKHFASATNSHRVTQNQTGQACLTLKTQFFGHLQDLPYKLLRRFSLFVNGLLLKIIHETELHAI